MKHSSIVGGSTAGRRIACTGSMALEAAAPKQESSSYADEGSMLHLAIEALVMKGVVPDLNAMIGFEAFGQTLTFDHLECLQSALNDWNTIADQYGIDIFDCEVSADWGPTVPGAFGSIDLAGTGLTHNVILDWKFGAGVRVRAESNQQGMFYAAGAMLDPTLDDLFNPELPTVIVIVQPRVEDGTSIDIVQPHELKAFIETVAAAIKIAQGPHATLVTGPHCRWCSAKVTCPKKLGLVSHLPAMDKAKLGDFMLMAEEAEDWAKAVKELAYNEANNGNVADGWKLVAKRATRKWVNAKDAEAALRGPGYRMKVADICDRVLKTAPAVEKILKAKGKALPEGYVTKESSGTTLVEVTDKRAAILPLANALKEIGKLA